MNPSPDPRNDDAARRKAVRRTLLVFGGIAVAIYIGFILRGVLSQ